MISLELETNVRKLAFAGICTASRLVGEKLNFTILRENEPFFDLFVPHVVVYGGTKSGDATGATAVFTHMARRTHLPACILRVHEEVCSSGHQIQHHTLQRERVMR